jgi:cytochrome c oxidase assembly protein subunit 11
MVSHAQANQQTLVKLLVVAVAMFGFGYALVPFYRAICDALGLNSVVKADAVANSQVDATRLLTVEFDTNLRSSLPWTFTPLEKSVRVHPGALAQVEFEVRNRSDRAVTGQAIPSFGPQLAGRYFKKLDCFCFTQQTLAPGEVRRMPVAFVVERELPQDIGTVTLSYTFFEVEGKARGSQGS